jgi:nucleoside-diphosphate-sugar epimerase
MNVFIAGSTGVLGRRLVQQFVDRGHGVFALVRSLEGERRVAALGAQPRWADLFDARGLVHAAQGADVVIHAATAIPNKARTTARDWELNDRIRREGTEALATCAGQIGAKLFIFQSIVWLASPADGSEFDETAPPRPTGLTQSALDGEQIAHGAGEKHAFGACVLRCGWFYGADSAHTKLFGRELMRRRMPIIGKGNAAWSCLHLDDAAGAFVAAAEAGKAGLWHVTDNEPVTVRDSLSGFAQRLGAPPPRTVPVWMARLLAGQNAVDFFTESTRATSARFRRDFDWSPRYPTYREGFDQIVAAWQGRIPQ